MRSQYQRSLVRLIELFDVIPDVPSRLWVKAYGRLVKEQDLGLVHEAPADLQPPFHPSGVIPHYYVGLVLQLDKLQDLGYLLGPLLLAYLVKYRMKLEVLSAGQVIVDGRVLEHDSYVLSHIVLLPPYVVPRDAGIAGRRRQQGCQHLYRCRLPGSVRPQQAEYLALAHIKRDVINSLKAPKLLGDLVDLYYVVHDFTLSDPSRNGGKEN